MSDSLIINRLILPRDIKATLESCGCVREIESIEELAVLSCGGEGAEKYEVKYTVPGMGDVTEAVIHRGKNGISVNFPEDYMRRRDADSMRIGDDLPTDKPRFKACYGYDFALLRRETLAWLSNENVIALPFEAGGERGKIPAVLLCPEKAAFFALASALMQGFIPAHAVPYGFTPRGIFIVAPPFRHTHFAGKQTVVHCRSKELHEVFAYNLYPGPSAKKGVFSLLLDVAPQGGRHCCHASAVLAERKEGGRKLRAVFMHEGASGGGKSELLQALPSGAEGKMLLAQSFVTGERLYTARPKPAALTPIADDMALCEVERDARGRLVISDAEKGWFLRVDGERGYGDNPALERASIHPAAPLEFFNIDCAPGSTCLVWEHTKDKTGAPCTNPRVIIPRAALGAMPGEESIAVDVRSLGVRMPPSTESAPNVGIMGLVQLVPPGLAWLWRLVSPRGYKNPSISPGNAAPTELEGEGVGAYWAFATGERAAEANILLRQLFTSPGTMNVLIPNQFIGAYEVGFRGEWLAREYLTGLIGRREEAELIPARHPLFGYAPREMRIGAGSVPSLLLRPEEQRELGRAGYDASAALLKAFFTRELEKYDASRLHPLGREILRLFHADAPAEEYKKLVWE